MNWLFSSTELKGCYYHFVQALWRWVQNHDCTVLYKDNSEFPSFIKCTAALAHVPHQFLQTAWLGIKAAAPEMPDCSEFNEYFIGTWLKGSFPILMWNHYDSVVPATNNHLEGGLARQTNLRRKPTQISMSYYGSNTVHLLNKSSSPDRHFPSRAANSITGIY